MNYLKEQIAFTKLPCESKKRCCYLVPLKRAMQLFALFNLYNAIVDAFKIMSYILLVKFTDTFTLA